MNSKPLNQPIGTRTSNHSSVIVGAKSGQSNRRSFLKVAGAAGLLTLAPSLAGGQVSAAVSPPVKFLRTYGGSSDDSFDAIVQTSDGGYALAGTTQSGTADGEGDFWLVKTDANGVQQWNKKYSGEGFETLTSMTQTSDGGYVLAGTTSCCSGTFKAILVRTNASGVAQWTKIYTQGDVAEGVIQTSDGGYALAGYKKSPTGNYNMWLMKTSATGVKQWSRTYGQGGVDVAYAVIQTSDGGYALAGQFTNTSGDAHMWLVKTSATGAMQWNRKFNKGAYDAVLSAVQTSDGGFALAGRTGPRGDGDIWLVKTSTTGRKQWEWTYNGGANGTDIGEAVIQTSDGGLALAGYAATSDPSDSPYLASSDALLVKFSA